MRSNRLAEVEGKVRVLAARRHGDSETGAAAAALLATFGADVQAAFAWVRDCPATVLAEDVPGRLAEVDRQAVRVTATLKAAAEAYQERDAAGGDRLLVEAVTDLFGEDSAAAGPPGEGQGERAGAADTSGQGRDEQALRTPPVQDFCEEAGG
jgi:membrane protein involved in colicin uptake